MVNPNAQTAGNGTMIFRGAAMLGILGILALGLIALLFRSTILLLLFGLCLVAVLAYVGWLVYQGKSVAMAFAVYNRNTTATASLLSPGLKKFLTNGGVIGVLIVVSPFLLVLVIKGFTLSWDHSMHRLFGTKTVYEWPKGKTAKPHARTGPSEGEVRRQALAEQMSIESKSFELTLTDGDTKPDWIRVPDGYKAVYSTGQTSLGMDCSSGIDAPPQNADGETYWCDPSDITARWFRPYIYQHAAKTVTFRYHYRHR